MKSIKIIGALILLLSLFWMACEKENHYLTSDNEFEEQKVEEISGDSFLKVVSECPRDTRVYFDGKYIGVVGVGSNRIWEVPSGKHTVRIFNNSRAACCAELDFLVGKATIVCSRQNMENDSIFSYEDEYIR